MQMKKMDPEFLAPPGSANGFECSLASKNLGIDNCVKVEFLHDLLVVLVSEYFQDVDFLGASKGVHGAKERRGVLCRGGSALRQNFSVLWNNLRHLKNSKTLSKTAEKIKEIHL